MQVRPSEFGNLWLIDIRDVKFDRQCVANGATATAGVGALPPIVTESPYQSLSCRMRPGYRAQNFPYIYYNEEAADDDRDKQPPTGLAGGSAAGKPVRHGKVARPQAPNGA